MVRGILGVVGGGIVWWMGFFGLARLLYLSWPAYATTAHEFMITGVSEFTTPMYAWQVLFWVLAEIAAGWIAVVIARRRESAWVLAALLMTFVCFMHSLSRMGSVCGLVQRGGCAAVGSGRAVGRSGSHEGSCGSRANGRRWARAVARQVPRAGRDA